MVDPMPKLPRYVFRRANGSYRYKRNVPKDLRPLIRKDTLYRQLGNSYADALAAYPLVHKEIETLFERERWATDAERASALVRARLGQPHSAMFEEGAVNPEWDVFEDFQDLAEAVRHQVPKGVYRQVKSAHISPSPMTLQRALQEYARYKSEDGKDNRGLETRLARIEKDLVLCLGGARVRESKLQDITRADANRYRDLLLARMSPNSVVRTIGVVKAALNFIIVEHDLELRNVFQGIKIKGAGASRADRLPITEEQLRALQPAFESNKVALTLLTVLTDTGARLSEITGLVASDVDIDAAMLHIRPNPIRSLKTQSSIRDVPLSPRAVRRLSAHTQELTSSDPVFPAYAKARGNDKASAMLMRRLRTVIDDKKITIHSLRHRMKDRLRNTNCPEALSEAILGHSQNTVASNYGSGYALENMRAALEKVWDSSPDRDQAKWPE